MKFSIKDFFNKYDQIRSLLRIWSHLLIPGRFIKLITMTENGYKSFTNMWCVARFGTICKINTLPWVFFTFFKLYKCYQLVRRITYFDFSEIMVADHIIRSSHLRCSVKKVVLRNFAKFTGKPLCQSLFFNKVAG